LEHEKQRQEKGHRPLFTFLHLDPSFAPGTGTPVVGGLSTFQAQSIIRGLGGVDLIAMDVVEVAPAYDHAEMTSLAAASVALDYLCLRAHKLPVKTA
jgi:agmatinase